MTWVGRVACVEGGRQVGARFSYGKMKGLLVRFRLRLEGVNWSDIAQDRDRWRSFVNAAMNFQLPLNLTKFLTERETVSF